LKGKLKQLEIFLGEKYLYVIFSKKYSFTICQWQMKILHNAQKGTYLRKVVLRVIHTKNQKKRGKTKDFPKLSTLST